MTTSSTSRPRTSRTARAAAAAGVACLTLLAGACSSSDDAATSSVAATAAPPPDSTAPPQTPRTTVAVTTIAPATTVAATSTVPPTAIAPTTVPPTTVAATTVPPTTAAPTTTAVPANEADRVLISGILDAHYAAGEFVGARISVLDDDGSIAEVAAGTVAPDPTSAAADLHTPWAIGSATKTFVAVVVLQLVDEGLIELDAPIARWFPDFADAERITPRMLLQHTSGINEYINTPAVADDSARPWTPDELIAVAEGNGRVGEPGGSFYYSNTNFVMLGEIVADVTGHSWGDEVTSRILEPLGMTSSGILVDGDVNGYSNVDGVFVDSVDKHPSIGDAAGAMKSTGHDLLLFIKAIADGTLLSAESQDAMHAFIPGEDLSEFGIVNEYGLGLERYSNDTIAIVGHMGSGNVNSAFIGYDTERGTAVAVTMNTDTPGPQAFMAIETLMALGN